jgi:uncharacterized Ntn-hydrolase superfamily protein
MDQLSEMTWSLIALDDKTGELGVAVATRCFAVGARVPFAAPNVGAIATQALVNPYYGIDGLQLLRDGHEPDEVLEVLLKSDPGREHRQAHIIDHKGRIAAHTGCFCLSWAGHLSGDCFSIAGNTLAGPQVLEQTLETFRANASLQLSQRMISAMQAGEEAGGAIGGRSAALLIFSRDEWSSLDIRVDEHANPLQELERLEKVSRIEWVGYRQFVPTRTDPVGVTDHEVIDAAIGSQMQDI